MEPKKISKGRFKQKKRTFLCNRPNNSTLSSMEGVGIKNVPQGK